MHSLLKCGSLGALHGDPSIYELLIGWPQARAQGGASTVSRSVGVTAKLQDNHNKSCGYLVVAKLTVILQFDNYVRSGLHEQRLPALFISRTVSR